MRAGKGRSDVYLSDWRREMTTCSDSLEAEAQVGADRLEEQYTDDDLLALIRAHGIPSQSVSR